MKPFCEEDTACCIALDALHVHAPAFCASKVALLSALGRYGLPMLPISSAAQVLHGGYCTMFVNMPFFSLPFMSLCSAWRLCRCRHSPAAPGRPTSGSPAHLLRAPPPQHRQRSQKLPDHLPRRHRQPPLQHQGLVETHSASLPARPPCRAIQTRNWRSTRRHSTSLQIIPSSLPWL